MTDSLSLLREYNINKKVIIERDGQIIFGELAWPKNSKTNCVRHKGGKHSKGLPKEYYTLECLLFILKNVDLIHPEYCNVAAESNTETVSRPDRKAILSYLNGQTDICASIDKTAPFEKPMKVKRKQDGDIGESASKNLAGMILMWLIDNWPSGCWATSGVAKLISKAKAKAKLV